MRAPGDAAARERSQSGIARISARPAGHWDGDRPLGRVLARAPRHLPVRRPLLAQEAQHRLHRRQADRADGGGRPDAASSRRTRAAWAARPRWPGGGWRRGFVRFPLPSFSAKVRTHVDAAILAGGRAAGSAAATRARCASARRPSSIGNWRRSTGWSTGYRRRGPPSAGGGDDPGRGRGPAAATPALSAASTRRCARRPARHVLVWRATCRS